MKSPATRAVAAVSGSLLAAGLLAGCASSADNATPAPTSTHRSASAHDVVAAAYDKTVKTGSAKIAVSVRVTGAGTPAGIDVSGSGVVDFANQNTEMTMQLPGGMGSMQVRYVGGTMYAKLPAQLGLMLGPDRTWVSIDLDQVARQQFGTTLSQLQSGLSANPADLLGFLRGTGQDVRELGPATIDGVPTTHYAVTIDLDKAVAGQSEQVRAAVQRAMKQIGTKDLPAQLWVDEQGRLRKLLMTMTMQLPARVKAKAGSAAPSGPVDTRVVTTLSDYGVPVDVAAPPKAQTQDLTGLLSGH